MAREIRVGGVKYMLAGSNEQGNVYVISPESAPVAPDPIKTEVSTEEFVVGDMGAPGDEQLVMFEEVGAEEVVSSNEYDLCFVDSGEIGDGSGSYQIVTGDQLGVVEEEVTTEIIKTEIQTDEGSDQFIVNSETLEYEEDINVKKVFVSKSSFEQPLNLVKKEKNGKFSVLPNSYVVSSNLKVQNRDVHRGDDLQDRLTCPDCGKLFTSKRSLVGHKKEKHSGTLEIFPCQHCGKNFSRKSNLKAHMDSIHFGKKFPCAYCDRIFTNRSCMNLHVKKQHTETVIQY